jgi:hypothetical protein
VPGGWAANAPVIVADGPNTSLRINITSTGGSPYNAWAAGPFQGTLSNTAADIDFDHGSLSTGIEWVVGGDPTHGSDDAVLSPTLDSTTDPDFLIFTYRRRDAANADPGTSITVRYGTDFGNWATANHGVAGVIIDASAVPAPGYRTVVVNIPKSLAVGGKLFARLNVVVTP